MFKSFGPAARGALFSFLAFTVWAFGDAFTKNAGLGGASITMIVFISSWSAVLTVLAGMALRREGLAKLRVHNKKVQAIRCVLFFGISFANVIAFTNLPLTTVYIGIFAAPFLISLFGALFMNEPLSLRQGASIALGFVGVTVALVPEIIQGGQTGAGNPALGYAALPVFMVLFVAVNLYLRILGRTETPESMTLYPFLFRGLFSFPLFFLEPASGVPLSALLFAFGMGITTGVGFLLISSAYKLAPMAIVSSFHYTQLLTGALLGYLFWGAVPSVWVWGGGALIVVSGLVMAHEARRMHKEQKILIEES